MKTNPNHSQTTENAIVIGVGLKSDSLIEIKESLSELEELVYSAGGEVVSSLTQQLEKYVPSTLLGKGKVEEVKNLIEETGSTLVIIDHQISGVQAKNLSQEWKDVRILDRSQLILDIFAQRAQTYEGKLQVELAQMMDQLPRMVGGWLGSLSRQAGGIGTRGPGETALELDRRRIRERVQVIKKKLDEVKKHRKQHRSQRQKYRVPSFALIGYTNAGKSTILNALTQSDVEAKDQVFATLDPTTRKVHLHEVGDAIITDTVGFIRKLPPNLIEAFKATLEESGEADVLLHVIDLSNPQMQTHIEVVDKIIHELGWDKKPIVYVFNKLDKAPVERQFQIKQTPRVFISAQKGENLHQLKKIMAEQVQSLKQEHQLFFPKTEEHKLFDLKREAQVLNAEQGRSGTVCKALLTEAQVSKWREFLDKN